MVNQFNNLSIVYFFKVRGYVLEKCRLQVQIKNYPKVLLLRLRNVKIISKIIENIPLSVTLPADVIFENMQVNKICFC